MDEGDAMRWTKVWLAVLITLLTLTACNGIKKSVYEGFGRDEWQKPERVIRSLDIQAGDAIADLGAGSGYFTFRLADAVGATGRVYAIDVDSSMLVRLEKDVVQRGYSQVQTILAEFADPKIPAGGVDLIFLSNTYHHLSDRIEYFRQAKKYLRPGGRIAIIDYNDHGGFANMIGHATKGHVIEKEMIAAGYQLQKQFDFLPKQSFLIFSK